MWYLSSCIWGIWWQFCFLFLSQTWGKEKYRNLCPLINLFPEDRRGFSEGFRKHSINFNILNWGSRPPEPSLRSRNGYWSANGTNQCPSLRSLTVLFLSVSCEFMLQLLPAILTDHNIMFQTLYRIPVDCRKGIKYKAISEKIPAIFLQPVDLQHRFVNTCFSQGRVVQQFNWLQVEH